MFWQITGAITRRCYVGIYTEGYTIDSGLDILYYGNIPNGSGLSSSASIEVATAVILNDQFGFDVDMVESARSASLREQIQRRKLWYHGSVCYTSEHRSMYSYVRLSIDRCTATYV